MKFIIILCSYFLLFISCNKVEKYYSILNYHSDEKIASLPPKELRQYETQLSKAIAFFEKKSLNEYAMLSLVKKGKVQMSSKHFLNAIVSLKSSLSYAETINDISTEAEIYRLLASIYRLCFEPTESLKCLKKAEILFAEIGNDLSRYNVLMDIGSIYLDLQEYNNSEKYFNKVILWAKTNQNSDILGKCMTKYARTLIKKSYPNPRLAIQLMEDAKSHYGTKLTVDDNSTLAYAYKLVGDVKLANKTIKQAQNGVNNVTSRLIYSYWQYKINEDSQNLDEQRKWQKVTDSLRTIIMNEALQESLRTAEIEYYRTQQINQEQELSQHKNNIQLFMLIFIPILLISIISIMAYHRHNKGKINKFEKSIEILSETNKYLIKNKDEYYRKVRKGDLVYILNEMIEAYYETKNDSMSKNSIFSILESFIQNTKNEKTIILEMENNVNLLSDNIIAKLRKECPNLKPNEYKLFTLLSMGFSFISIGVLMSLEAEQVYRQKYRLKQKIKSSQSKSTEQFLSVLS